MEPNDPPPGPVPDNDYHSFDSAAPYVKKRSVKLRGHATSISLEEPFWRALGQIAKEEKRSMQKLIEFVDEYRTGNLSSALRLYVLADLEHKLKKLQLIEEE